MKPLSVGNIVSAGLRIYRDNFKKYYRLAFIAHLWIVVPIYGWAKFSASSGLIARLAHGEVREKPESIKEARSYIKPRTWKFFGAAILVALVSILGAAILVALVNIMGIIFLSLFTGIFGAIIGSTGNTVIAFIVAVAFILLFLFCITRFFSRLLIYDLPLAIEENISASRSISRGWSLTKGSVFKVQLVFFISFLISLPVSILVNLLSVAFQLFVGYLLALNSDFAVFLSPILFIVPLLIFFASGALLMPFWQAIKAVIYYDLLVSKEGLGLELES